VCSAKSGEAFVPLKSTSADVEKLLEFPGRNLLAYYYRFHDELAVLVPIGACDQCSWDWHVPVGTVTTIGVILVGRGAKAFADRGIQKRRYKGGFVYYTNEVDGLTVETHKGQVTSLHMDQKRDSDDLRCVPKDCIVATFRSFDEYSLLRMGRRESAARQFCAIVLGKRWDVASSWFQGPTKQESQIAQTCCARQKAHCNSRAGTTANF
jgi:hypothetical protein